ncbi:MAG: hypothetical protein QGI83_10590 [Candidatus Latescibacteria bacterium]|jgi:hypothetical protein|nr:hypothetical protein [Candidatus Latescibacterota bacterium]
MEWLYVVVLLAFIIYTVYVIGDYNTFLREEQPRIERIEGRADKLGQAADGEALLRDQVAGRVAEAKALVSELKNTITATQREVQTEQGREQDLEMDMYKSEFKRSKHKA